MGKALYTALSKAGSLEWFDSSVPIDEIEEYFKKQDEFAYGILGAATADCIPNKDMIIWKITTDLEIYSNYKGRKVIALKLEELLNYISSQGGWDAMQNVLKGEGFIIGTVTVEGMRVNLPVYSDKGIWQSGSAGVTLTVNQL